MPLESLESVSDPFAQDSRLDRAPESSPLRVSQSTQFESGIPPARLRANASLERGVEKLDLALAGVTRTEANLGLLVRGLKHLAAGASAAREANTELSNELDALRTHLARSHEEEHALRFRMSQLEQLLDVIRHETARERAFLIEQHDSFLVEIMTDHDCQVAELRRTLKEAGLHGAESRQREIDELIAQRAQAREYATRCERERDAAWQELAASEATPVPATRQRPFTSPSETTRLSPAPLPVTASEADPLAASPDDRRGSSPTAIGSISLRAVQLPASQSSAPDAERASVSQRSSSGTSYSLSREDIPD